MISFLIKNSQEILLTSEQFETELWSLTTEDGRVLQLLDEGRGDPFKESALQP